MTSYSAAVSASLPPKPLVPAATTRLSDRDAALPKVASPARPVNGSVVPGKAVNGDISSNAAAAHKPVPSNAASAVPAQGFKAPVSTPVVANGGVGAGVAAPSMAGQVRPVPAAGDAAVKPAVRVMNGAAPGTLSSGVGATVAGVVSPQRPVHQAGAIAVKAADAGV